MIGPRFYTENSTLSSGCFFSVLLGLLSGFPLQVWADIHVETAEDAEDRENDTDEVPPDVQWVEAPRQGGNGVDGGGTFLGVPEGKNPRYVLEKVVIKGNRKTLRQVIMRYLEVAPGDVFSADDERLEHTRFRLLGSGLFSDVQLSLERGNKRGTAVLLIEVKERNTIVVQDISFGFSEISSFFGSFDVAERSFLGSGVDLSGAAVFSVDGQYGYRLRLKDYHFLNSSMGLHVEGLFAKARDFFGKDGVCITGDNPSEPADEGCESLEYQKSVQYGVLRYRRGGGRIGTGFALLGINYFSLDYRFEVINAHVPAAGYHTSFEAEAPLEFGHMHWGDSIVSSFIFGIVRDTRDSITLTTTGTRTSFGVEVAAEVLGSDYEYSKFTLSQDFYFPLRWGHSLKLGLFGGLIMGDAPFYNQFFVGDFSSFVPSRVLDLNFSHLQTNFLPTTVREMRYEDMAASLNVEYSLPFYKGSKFVYGVTGFLGLGVFFLASTEDLKYDPKGYQGYEVVPFDFTADLGIKIDTRVGLFVLSLATVTSNLLVNIPSATAPAKE